MNDDPTQQQVWRNAGRIDEIESHLKEMSARLDAHILACTARFFLMLGAITVATGVIALIIKG